MIERIAVLVLVVAADGVLASAQSLGDAARQQARKRTSRTGVARTYGDADLVAHATRDGEQVAPDPAAASARGGEDEVRAELDREAAERHRREVSWKQQASAALARIEAAQRAYDAACAPGLPSG